jgi:hypothetical protein
MEKEIVVDTGILLDILLRSRPRHKFAKRIGAYLVDHGIRIKVPMHALFEIKSAMLEEQWDARIKGESIPLNEDISEHTPLNYHPVAIDEGFFRKYFHADITGLKAGDYPFVAMAKGDGLALVTDELPQYAAAKAAGVRVYTGEEYRAHCLNAPDDLPS